MRNTYKRSAFFDVSDDLFYRISLIGFLVVFSSMVFFLTKYREKKVNDISQISITEQIKLLKQYCYSMDLNIFLLKVAHGE